MSRTFLTRMHAKVSFNEAARSAMLNGLSQVWSMCGDDPW